MVQAVYYHFSAFVLHTIVILNYVLFLVYKESIKDDLDELYPERKQFGGSWNYLTHWNIILQLAYFTLAILNDIFGTESRAKEVSSRLQKSRDFLFSTLAFPIGIFVPITFWILFYIDRDLVFPADLDQVFPAITNHMMHTTSLPSQILELLLVYHVYPPRKYGFPAIVSFCLAYISWIFYIAYAGGIWVYAVLEVLTQYQRLMFVISLSLFGIILYLIGEWCNNKAWKQPQKRNGYGKSVQNGSIQQERYKNGRKYK